MINFSAKSCYLFYIWKKSKKPIKPQNITVHKKTKSKKTYCVPVIYF